MKQGTKRLWQSLILALGLVLGGGTGAHSDEHLASVPAPHGGQLRMAGAHHLKLVVLPDSIRVYVTDHASQPVRAGGAKGSVTVWSGEKRTEVPLTPAGGNLLSGKARLNAAPDARVTVHIRLPGQKAESAEFAPASAGALRAFYNPRSGPAARLPVWILFSPPLRAARSVGNVMRKESFSPPGLLPTGAADHLFCSRQHSLACTGSGRLQSGARNQFAWPERTPVNGVSWG